MKLDPTHPHYLSYILLVRVTKAYNIIPNTVLRNEINFRAKFLLLDEKNIVTLGKLNGKVKCDFSHLNILDTVFNRIVVLLPHLLFDCFLF